MLGQNGTGMGVREKERTNGSSIVGHVVLQ